MSPAQIGPLTALFESIATAVGAGILLGGFVAGIYRLVREWPRQDRLEAHVLIDGYAGGLAGVAVVLLDLAFSLWLGLTK